MLLNVHVKNLALIEDIEINFKKGLNILTGETGAGKSIIIGSINAALGGKLSKEMIRPGAEYALVEVTFLIKDAKIIDLLKQKEVYPDDELIVISRKFSNGKSTIRINGELINASTLAEITSLLIDVHGQHDHQSLLKNTNHIGILDSYAYKDIIETKLKLKTAYQEYKELLKQSEEFNIDEEAKNRELALLEYEINEIEDANILPDEDNDVEEKFRLMNNSKKIVENLSAAYSMLGYENDQSAGSIIDLALKDISLASNYDNELSDILTQANDMNAICHDMIRDIETYIDRMNFDEEDIYKTEQRYDLINHIKGKYGNSTDKIAEYLDTQKKRYELLKDYEKNKSILDEKIGIKLDNLEKIALNLSKIRKDASEAFEKEIISILKDMNFLDVKFKVLFNKLNNCTENGFDDVVFMVSTNPGEPLLELSKVASGGELSRIMLAIKTMIAQKDSIDTLIFDEIDTGISGITADKIGKLLKDLSFTHQIICITHLAQIASKADTHFLIKKDIVNDKTTTFINELDYEQSIAELARIIGGSNVTASVIQSAKDMKV